MYTYLRIPAEQEKKENERRTEKEGPGIIIIIQKKKRYSILLKPTGRYHPHYHPPLRPPGTRSVPSGHSVHTIIRAAKPRIRVSEGFRNTFARCYV